MTFARPSTETTASAATMDATIDLLRETLASLSDGGEQVALALAAVERLATEHNRLAALAETDALTGLANRAALDAALAREAAAGTSGTLLFIDLDRFKAVNDTFGHATGDAVLAAAARRIDNVVRADSLVARLGGDEFAVLLPTVDVAVAATVARRILRALRAPFSIGGQTVSIGASIGLAAYPDHATDAATLLRASDAAMYIAKLGGLGVMTFSASAAFGAVTASIAPAVAAQASTGRPGWRRGHGEEASSWFAGIGGQRGCVTRIRGMFYGELPRPGSRGVVNVGERPNLAAAQIAVEAQAERFGASIEPAVRRARRLPGERFGRAAIAA